MTEDSPNKTVSASPKASTPAVIKNVDNENSPAKALSVEMETIQEQKMREELLKKQKELQELKRKKQQLAAMQQQARQIQSEVVILHISHYGYIKTISEMLEYLLNLLFLSICLPFVKR